MENAKYVLVGDVMPSAFVPFLGLAGIIGIVFAFFSKTRWTGILAALGMAVVVVAKVPSPWLNDVGLAFLYAGMTVDLIRGGKVNRRGLLRDLGWKAMSLVLFLVMGVLINTGEDITIRGDQLYSSSRGFGVKTVEKRQLALLELTGWHGELAEWRFVSTSKSLPDPFICSTWNTRLYLDRWGRLLTGKQVVKEIAQWARINSIHRTYEDYVYNGNHAL